MSFKEETAKLAQFANELANMPISSYPVYLRDTVEALAKIVAKLAEAIETLAKAQP